MRSYSVAVLLLSILVCILLLEEDDLIEARIGKGGRGGSSSSKSSSRSSSVSRSTRSRSSRSRSTRSRSSRSKSSASAKNRGTQRRNSRRVVTTANPTTSWVTTSSYHTTSNPTTLKATTQRPTTQLPTTPKPTSFWESKRWRQRVIPPEPVPRTTRRTYIITNAPHDNYNKRKTKVSMATIAGSIIGTGVFILFTTTFCFQCLQTRHTTLANQNPDYQQNTTPSAPQEAADSSSPNLQPVYLPINPGGPVRYAQSQSPAYFSNIPPPHYPGPQPHSNEGTLEEGAQAPLLSEAEDTSGNISSSVQPSCPPYSSQPFNTGISPPVEDAGDSSVIVSAPEDAPPPSYHDLFKS